jgi:anti-sigma regulatory factor (Ser/Thr protein kinase)
MVNEGHTAYKVADRSYFSLLKKEIHGLAVSAGFSESKVGEIDIIISEMVTNLVKHAGEGQVLVKLLEEEGIRGMEIISIDNGPGMNDVSRMVADGVSTTKTLGHGLGAMNRLSDFFQIYSQKEWGTVILVRVFEKEFTYRKSQPLADIRSVVLPKPGEKACGDGFYFTETKDHLRLFLGDGLGHGPEAARAVQEAGKAFATIEATDPVEIIRQVHPAVKKTRGLVGTVAVFDIRNQRWRMCGVGNISAKIISLSSLKNYMPYNGIIGLNIPNSMSVQELEHEKGQQLILCSDGIKTKWDTVRYPAIARYDLSVTAATLIKDFARLTDDMSVAICKINLS